MRRRMAVCIVGGISNRSQMEMPKVSKESAARKEVHGPVEDRSEDIEGGYTVTFVSFGIDIDGAPLLKGLPYVLKGAVGFRGGAGEEVFNTGDAFYVAP